MKHVQFGVSPYPIRIHVCSLDYPILKKVDVDPELVHHDKGDIAETWPGARAKRNGACVIVIRLPEQYDEETVWHESIHAAAFLLDMVGSMFTADSMDTIIYPTEYIVRQIKQKFYKIGVKKCSKSSDGLVPPSSQSVDSPKPTPAGRRGTPKA